MPRRSKTWDHMSCEQCGEPHVLRGGDKPSCRGHRKTDGAPCGQPPMAGQDICRKHGGKAPQNLAAGVRRLQRKGAEDATRAFGLPREVDPHSALLEELHRTAGAVAWLGEIVGGLADNQITWGQTRYKTGGEDFGQTYAATPNIWYVLWQEQRKHLKDVAVACAAAGIEERRIRLAEDQGRLVAGVIQRILAGMLAALVGRLDELDVARQLVEAVWADLVKEIVPHELRAMAASEVAS